MRYQSKNKKEGIDRKDAKQERKKKDGKKEMLRYIQITTPKASVCEFRHDISDTAHLAHEENYHPAK